GVGIVAATGRLLRRHVWQGTKNSSIGSRRAADILGSVVEPGEAEIEYVRIALAVGQNVSRLEIAVIDPLGVSMLNRLGHADQQIGFFVQRTIANPAPGARVEALD